MAEPLNFGNEHEPFGPPEMLAIPLDRNGNVQLAESFTTDGTVIEWERHNYTRTDDPDVEARRLAIITDSADNVYFLTADVLYDIADSQAKKRPVGDMFDEDDQMPDVTIGQDAVFTNGNTVKSVLIATDRLDSRDPVNTNRLAGVQRPRRNPFLEASMAIQALAQGQQDQQQQAPRRRYTTYGGQELFSYSVVPDPTRVGAVRKALDHYYIERGEKDPPRWKLSRYGMPISPRTEGGTNWYKPRPEEALGQLIGEHMLAIRATANQAPGLRQLAARKERKRDERTWAYWRRFPNNKRPEEYRE